MITSLDIAKSMGRSHRQTLRDLRSSGVQVIKATYTSDQNKHLPCLLLHPQDAIVFISRTDRGKKLAASFIGNTIGALEKLMDMIASMDIEDPEIKIYFMLEIDTGNIKIGASKQPELRVKQLQTGNSSRLEIIAVFDSSNAMQQERAIHKQVVCNLIRGEWFNPKVLTKLESLPVINYNEINKELQHD